MIDPASRASLDEPRRALMTLATPWTGHEAAASGVRALPYPISWFDLEARSTFLEDLFWKPGQPPRSAEGCRTRSRRISCSAGRAGALPGLPGDGVASFDSPLRSEAQLDADSVFGVPADHARILHHPLPIERVSDTLDELAARR